MGLKVVDPRLPVTSADDAAVGIPRQDGCPQALRYRAVPLLGGNAAPLPEADRVRVPWVLKVLHLEDSGLFRNLLHYLKRNGNSAVFSQDPARAPVGAQVPAGSRQTIACH